MIVSRNAACDSLWRATGSFLAMVGIGQRLTATTEAGSICDCDACPFQCFQPCRLAHPLPIDRHMARQYDSSPQRPLHPKPIAWF
jgi:hypothetical protein